MEFVKKILVTLMLLIFCAGCDLGESDKQTFDFSGSWTHDSGRIEDFNPEAGECCLINFELVDHGYSVSGNGIVTIPGNQPGLSRSFVVTVDGYFTRNQNSINSTSLSFSSDSFSASFTGQRLPYAPLSYIGLFQSDSLNIYSFLKIRSNSAGW